MPKWRERKRNRCGIGNSGNLRAIMGKEQAEQSVNTVKSAAVFVLTKSTEEEDYEHCCHMYRGVVHAFVGCTAAWLESFILSPLELSGQHVRSEVLQRH